MFPKEKRPTLERFYGGEGGGDLRSTAILEQIPYWFTKIVRLSVVKPYSQDLCERAIAALEVGKTQAEVAAQFGTHKSTLEKQ